MWALALNSGGGGKTRFSRSVESISRLETVEAGKDDMQDPLLKQWSHEIGVCIPRVSKLGAEHSRSEKPRLKLYRARRVKGKSEIRTAME